MISRYGARELGSAISVFSFFITKSSVAFDCLSMLHVVGHQCEVDKGKLTAKASFERPTFRA